MCQLNHTKHLLCALVVGVIETRRQCVGPRQDAPLHLGAEAGTARAGVHAQQAVCLLNRAWIAVSANPHAWCILQVRSNIHTASSIWYGLGTMTVWLLRRLLHSLSMKRSTWTICNGHDHLFSQAVADTIIARQVAGRL